MGSGWKRGPAGAAPAAAPPDWRCGSPRNGSAAAEGWKLAAKKSVLLRALPSEGQAYVHRACSLVGTTAGKVIYKQGDDADAFYVVQSGRYAATQLGADGETQQTVRRYEASDTFGSHELLQADQTRATTMTVLEAGSVWVIPKKVFDAKLKVAPAPAPSLVEKVRSCRSFAELAPEQITLLCRAVVNISMEKSKPVCKQGDAAHSVYALLDGQLKIVKDNDQEGKKLLKTPESKGACLGEACFFPDETMRVHDADISAWAGSSTLLKFSCADVEALIGYSLQSVALLRFHQQMLASVLIAKEVPMLKSIGDGQLDWLCSALVHEPPIVEGNYVVKEGQLDDRLYMIHRGQAAITTAEFGEAGVLEPGQYFGELSMTGRKRKRTSSVVCKGPEPLMLVSLSMALVRTNPQLEAWTRSLDASVTAVQGGGAAAPAKKGKPLAAVGDKGLTDKTSKADTSSVGAPKQGLPHRRSFGEMLVDAQKASAVAAEKAVRAAKMANAKSAASEKPKRNSGTGKHKKERSSSNNKKEKENFDDVTDELEFSRSRRNSFTERVAQARTGGTSLVRRMSQDLGKLFSLSGKDSPTTESAQSERGSARTSGSLSEDSEKRRQHV